MHHDYGQDARDKVTIIANRIAAFAASECANQYDIVIYVRDRNSTPSINGHGMSEKYRVVAAIRDKGLRPVIQAEIAATIDRMML
jgi:hypothetical protein